MKTEPTPNLLEAGVDVPLSVRVPEACRVTGISRTKLYQLVKDGQIASVSLREPGQTKATRLILYLSLVQYLQSKIDNRP